MMRFINDTIETRDYHEETFQIRHKYKGSLREISSNTLEKNQEKWYERMEADVLVRPFGTFKFQNQKGGNTETIMMMRDNIRHVTYDNDLFNQYYSPTF